MKKFLLALLLPIAASAQKMPSINLDKFRINEPEQTIVAEHEPVEQDLKVKNDRLYYWYSSNTIHTTQGGYSGQILNGLYAAYYLNKNLKEQGNFTNGLKDGTWKTWNEKGKLTQELNWRLGVLSGKFNTYDSEGKLKQTGQYKDNLLEGRSVIYFSPDSARTIKYHHGKINNEKDLTIWQKFHLAKKTPDSLKTTTSVKKDKDAKQAAHTTP